MRQSSLPPTAIVLSFIDRINRGDVDGLSELMTEDHHLVVLDEEPLVGRAANVEAWRGYASSYPRYVIHPRLIAGEGNRVAVLGTTTGSHLGLPDADERRLAVIWVAEVIGQALQSWRIEEDSQESRDRLGLRLTTAFL